MVKSDSAPIHPITSSHTYVIIEKVGSRINKRFEDSSPAVPNQHLKKTFQEYDIKRNSSSSLPKNSSVKFSCDSTLINEDDYEVDRSPNISDSDVFFETLDIIQSRESLIKYYHFDSSKYNSDTNKCVAFWKTIMERQDLKPVECIFEVSSFDFSSDSENEAVTEEIKDASKTCVTEEPEEYIWYNALLEMQKKRMDELALAATGRSCRLCDPEMGFAKFKTKRGKNYSEKELQDDEDIVCLNRWQSKSIKKPQIRQTAAVPEMNKPTKEEESFDLENIDAGETVRTCACGKVQCKCAGLVEKEKVIAPKEGEIKTMDHKEHDKTERNIKFQIVTAPKEKMENLTPLIKAQKPLAKKSDAQKVPRLSVAPIAISKKPKQFKTHGIFQHQGLIEAEPKCTVCKKEQCTCKEYFEEDSKEFVEEVRYELQYLRKDKSCATYEEKLLTAVSEIDHCSVCEDKAMCDLIKKKNKIAEVTIPTKGEDIFLETIFQSPSTERSYSMTVSPTTRGKKKSTAFSSSIYSSNMLEEKSIVVNARDSSASVKQSLEKKLETKNTDSATMSDSQDSSEITIRQGEMPKFQKRSLLWYSSEISNN